MKELQLGFAAEYFQKVAGQAEDAQQYPPGSFQADEFKHIPQHAQPQHPGPELQGVGDGAKRADVLAPEHVYEKAAQEQQGNRDDGHPEGDLPLESGGYGIIRIQVLAEEFAGGGSHVEQPEHQGVLKDAEKLVRNALALDYKAFESKAAAKFQQQVLHGAHGAEISAEQLTEEHHCCSKAYTQDNLERAHAAGQGTANAVGCKGLQAAEGAEGFRVRGLKLGEDHAGQA